MSQRSERGLVLSWFRTVWRGHHWAAAFLIVGSALNAALATTVPWLWQFVVDEVRGDDASTVRVTELGLWMVAVGVAQSLFYVLLQSSRTVMNGKIQWRARQRLFDHLIGIDSGRFSQWRVGDLVTRVSDDAGEKTAWFLCSGIFRAFEALLVVIAGLIAMMIIDPSLAVIVILPLPVLIVSQAFAQGALERRYRRVQEAKSDINDSITTTFSAIRIVQSANLGPQLAKRFGALAKEQESAEIRAARIQQWVIAMYGYGWQLAIVALLLAGGARVLDGTLTLGEYVTYEGLLMMLIWPMFDFGTFLSRFKQSTVALGRVQRFLDEATVPLEGRTDPDDALDEGELGIESPVALEVRGLTVKANDGTPLIETVDLSAPSGSTIAVVGGVGAGKSVLLEALASAPDGVALGEISLSGAAIRDLDRSAARLAIAHVPQDPVLISATVRENILLGREPKADALDAAVTIARLAQDIPQLPDGLDTVVGERGVTLSGGQQQRVALARALVGEPGLLLLDDATAALDAKTETAFWNGLEEALPDLTCVVVTHRVATVERADSIVVLRDGAVVQKGTHDELIAEDGGEYLRIYGRYRAQEALEEVT